MLVKERMTVNPWTVDETTPLMEAGEIMRKNKVSRLPVLREGKLIGIITHDDLLKASPSAATTLSVWELNYVLSKIVVKDVMTKDPVTVSSESTLEEAAMLMRHKDVGALPVVSGEKLVGIITESDIFDAFLDLMGLQEVGTRLAIDLENRTGVIAEITELIKAEGMNIVSMALFHRTLKSGELVLRLDSQKTEGFIKKLQDKGYKVIHVATFN